MFKLLRDIANKLKGTPEVTPEVKSQFPKEVKDHAYCIQWYLYLSKLRDEGAYNLNTINPKPDMVRSPAEGSIAFNPWRVGLIDGNAPDLIDGLIPAIRKDGKVGLYRQEGEKHRDNAFYDGAPWDDGYMVDLVLVKEVDDPIS